MNLRKVSVVIAGVAAIGWGTFYTVGYFVERADDGVSFDQRDIALPIVEEERVLVNEPDPVVAVPEKPAAAPKTWVDVPFTSQAPTGEWGRNEFQNGCEEASVLMVHAWRTGKAYTRDDARRELMAMARHQEKAIGQGIDTDAKDTAEILLADYFNRSDYRLAYDFTLDELKNALAEGLIIVPTNGRMLGNPNFTPPGPIQHMLVITGYDEVTKEFITNDPGTRKGEGYRYDEEILYAAIREYPTGNHFPIKTARKAMIVIPSNSNP